ncbi:DUF3885 domain-containing protein [Bacillus mangrovi]|uniref:DUF3885 domain-containing protein n=1 Tax=Metabacillus mangrovi TaxID=1491830 RepID=A0A7X2S772_9BACI|nr:DUF3885 domain-containing protein [Metabacillus mangrovi]MTH54934.1 DUF3885 domain-containing protein [Metabacillus mangrovi]
MIHPFLNTHFPHLILRPALFYSWKYGIRFEISMPGLDTEHPQNQQQIAERSTRIFDDVFLPHDEVLLVTDIHCAKNDAFLKKRPLNVYQKYIRDKEKRKKLQHLTLPEVFNEEDMVTHRFFLPCQKGDIRYKALLRVISFEDTNHPAKIGKGFPQAGVDLYFVNLTRKIIYHLYDDRGCDVIASRKEELRSLYEKRQNWILDDDREQIEKLFH